MKKCKYCKTEIDKSAKICPQCGKKQELPKWMIILGIVVAVIIIVSIFSSGEETTNNNSTTNNNGGYINESNNNNDKEYENDNSNSSTNINKVNKYTLGDTITFDGLELTFDKEYTFVTVSNRYSDYNGNAVIKIGVNVKNISSEKNNLNMFFYEFFGSQGIELDGISSYFDEAVDDGGELKPGASYKKYFYILYDGNGTYSIDFDNYSEEVSVEFEIVK